MINIVYMLMTIYNPCLFVVQPPDAEVQVAHVRSLAINKNSSIAMCMQNDNIVYIYDKSDLTKPIKTCKHENEVYQVIYSPDGKILAVAETKRGVHLWDNGKGQSIGLLEEKGGVEVIAISPDGKLLASASIVRGNVNIWNLANMKNIASLDSHGKGVWSLAFSSDSGHLSVGCEDGKIIVWDTKTSQQLELLESHSKPVLALIYNTERKCMLSMANDYMITVWSNEYDKTEVNRIDSSNRFHDANFSISGTYLITVDDKQVVKVWQANTGKKKCEFTDSTFGCISALAIDNSEKWIVYGGKDKKLVIVEINCGK
jgi:WD40 repeat protein